MVQLAPIFSKSENKVLLGLERVRKILSYFGNPQECFQSCVVTGTVGKGQIATNIAHNLSYFGKIGLYTSPHLERFSERIKILHFGKEREISEDEIFEISNLVFSAEKRLGVELTYFEHATVMAFLWFKENGIDFASLEVGMGGRLDAVSTANAKLGVISKIHFDHMNYLGESLYDIAYEKALCVPAESTRITMHKPGDVQFEAIRDVSNGRIINDFYVKDFGFENVDSFFLKGRLMVSYDEDILVNFFGPYGFIENSVLSSVSSHLILKEFFDIARNDLFFDIRLVKGRVERKGNFIYDGGHNPASAEFLSKTLPNMVFVVAFMKDKDWKSFIKILKDKIDYLYITRVHNERALSPEDIKSFTDDLGINSEIILIDEIPKVVSRISNLVCFTGTFYLYKVFKDTFRVAGF